MTDFYAFAPDAERAQALDRRMQEGLADSLRHIHERMEPNSKFEHQLLERTIATIDDGAAMPPTAFGWYYETADALFAEDFDAANAAASRLTGLGPALGGLAINRYGGTDDGPEGNIYQRRLNDLDGERYRPAPDDLMESFPKRVNKGFEMLDRSVPQLAGEIRALIREIVLGVAPRGVKVQFDGLSSYQLWGLLMLNPEFHTSPVAVAEVLAHESAHSLLFGYSFNETLVLNPDEELYPSPLRIDLRPMDGIYHATYVSARMCWAMKRVADDTGIDGESRAAAKEAAELDVKNFAAGHGVVAEHGDLTETGKTLMDRAEAYMRTAA